MSFEGVKFYKLGSTDPHIQTAIKIRTTVEMSAYEISQRLCHFGDVYVVKDSALVAYIEFSSEVEQSILGEEEWIVVIN